MISSKLPHVFYGGDYCPEQWPQEIWQEDMRLMKQAGVNLVTLAVFNWVKLQPSPDTYTFDWLDRVMDMLADNGIYADLGTTTAAPPAWMSHANPDLMPVDELGRRWSYGSRQTFCPNHPVYREFGRKLVGEIGRRYAGHPALLMWHVNNELSHGVTLCYCDNCASAFRDWLERRYEKLDKLNETWGTEIWGQLYTAWEQIRPPRKTSAQINPTQLLDYRRFMNDTYLGILAESLEILRRESPGVPATTNFLYEKKYVQYHRFARELDFVAISAFPDPRPGSPIAEAVFNYSIMRSLKGGQPFVLMEQAANNVAWREINSNKKPGLMRLWSYQALAHGADGVMFFQWRQSRKGGEKFHSAMVPHHGPNSRVFNEVCQLGGELRKLDRVIDSKVHSEAAILIDYETWWAVEYPRGLTNKLKYNARLKRYFGALHKLNIHADTVPLDADFDRYKIIFAPLLYMVKPGLAQRIETFVRDGGIFVCGFFSGIVDETDTVFDRGYPGPLREVLGIEVEEHEALQDGVSVGMRVAESFGGGQSQYTCELWREIVHPVTAEALAGYADDWFGGHPCVTENRYGKGRAYYIASQVEEAFLRDFFRHLCARQSVTPAIDAPEGVEVVKRHGSLREFLFVLNHSDREQEVKLPPGSHVDLITSRSCTGTLSLAPCDVAVLSSE